jgi:hypothetical protein
MTEGRTAELKTSGAPLILVVSWFALTCDLPHDECPVINTKVKYSWINIIKKNYISRRKEAWQSKSNKMKNENNIKIQERKKTMQYF